MASGGWIATSRACLYQVLTDRIGRRDNFAHETKIALARLAQRVVMSGGGEAMGRGPIIICWRGALRWKRDLREGIDFTIFLLGGFEREMTSAY